MRSLKELNFNVEKEYVFNKKQTLISDFFLKLQMVMRSMDICCVFYFFTPLSIKTPMTPTWINFWYKENFWCNWPKMLIFL